MRYAKIASTGRYVPKRMVTNRELETRMGETFDEWLLQNVGIAQRHLMADDEVTSDLAVAAARQALERAGATAESVDLIIVATDTPDYISPATSSVVQHKLGATRAATYDLNCACAGWVTALDQASKNIIADPAYRRVLVIGAYGMSRYVDWKDKKTCTLFADGAGAVLLEASDEPGFMGGRLSADGSFHDALGIYHGGTFQPADGIKPTVKFVRRFPPTFNTERWPRMLAELADRSHMHISDIKLFVFTQLNLRTIEETMKVMGQPMSKAHWTMDKWGYTGSACIPMTLDDAVEQGKLAPGDVVAFCATGGGLALAASLFRWTGTRS